MTNEAIKSYSESQQGDVIQDYTVADGTGIEKGAILKLTDPRTAILADGDNDVLAGIAAREKVANDGRTRLAVYKKGYFEMPCSGAVTLGGPVSVYASTGASNTIYKSPSGSSGAQILGYAEETGSANETILVRLNL